MRELGREKIEHLAIGAAVLGTGGGGDPYIGKLMALQAIERHGAVRLIELDEVPDDALIVPSAMMGAPTVMVEKIPKGDEAVAAFRQLESALGKRAFATISIEAGGLNSTTPLGVAATLGLPLVDCDGMGRAFPEIQMVTPTIYGIRATPMAMADEKGNSVLLDTVDNLWTERISRVVTVEMGGSALIALYPMTGAQLKEACIPGSITLAIRIGRTILEAHTRRQSPIDQVLEATGGFQLFRGKIVDVERRTVKGFARGMARLEGIDTYHGKELRIEFQNENLVALVGGRVIASVPDLITVLELETGRPVTTEGLRYGYRCAVVGIPCNERWRTPRGLELVGPRYFGYDVDYVPIEQRMATEAA